MTHRHLVLKPKNEKAPQALCHRVNGVQLAGLLKTGVKGEDISEFFEKKSAALRHAEALLRARDYMKKDLALTPAPVFEPEEAPNGLD